MTAKCKGVRSCGSAFGRRCLGSRTNTDTASVIVPRSGTWDKRGTNADAAEVKCRKTCYGTRQEPDALTLGQCLPLASAASEAVKGRSRQSVRQWGRSRMATCGGGAGGQRGSMHEPIVRGKAFAGVVGRENPSSNIVTTHIVCGGMSTELTVIMALCKREAPCA